MLRKELGGQAVLKIASGAGFRGKGNVAGPGILNEHIKRMFDPDKPHKMRPDMENKLDTVRNLSGDIRTVLEKVRSSSASRAVNSGRHISKSGS